MTLREVCFFLLIFCNTINCDNSTSELDIDTEKETICQVKTCIPKCCQESHVVKKFRNCTPDPSEELDFSDLEVYDADLTKVVSTVKDQLHLVPAMFENDTFRTKAIDMGRLKMLKTYLTEDGALYIEYPNAYHRWTKIDSSHFCVDYIKGRNKKPTPHVWIVENNETEQSHSIILPSYVRLGSCVFLILILIVHPLVPRNRNIGGVLEMLFTFSILKTIVLLSVMAMKEMKPKACLKFTYSIYFFYIASFCWMTVIAFDLWTTFKYCTRKGPITRMKVSVKIFLYCLYAWGVPSIMTAGLVVMNSLDLRHLPWIIQPRLIHAGCFISDGQKALYLFTPTLILLFICIIFYLLMIQSIVRITRGTTGQNQDLQVSSADIQRLQIRFNKNIALLAAMFLHSVLEMVNSLAPTVDLTYTTDIYNILLSPLLFFILILYAEILTKRIVRRQVIEAKPQSTPSTDENHTMTIRSGRVIRRVERPLQTTSLIKVSLDACP